MREAEEKDIEDSFPGLRKVANRRCRVYPRSEKLAVIRFGNSFKDMAIALPSDIYLGDNSVSEQDMMEVRDFEFGDFYFNARRLTGSLCRTPWLASLVWKGTKKPFHVYSKKTEEQTWDETVVQFQALGDIDHLLEPGVESELVEETQKISDISVLSPVKTREKPRITETVLSSMSKIPNMRDSWTQTRITGSIQGVTYYLD
jgi:hypothetical protein